MRTALRILGLLLFLFVLLGLMLHSVPGGTLLGRWTPRYALGLVLLTGLGWPWWKLLVFLTEDTVFTGSQGQEVRIPTRLKGQVAFVLVLLAFLPVEFALHRRANRRTRKDWKKFHPFLQHQNRRNRSSLHTNGEGFRGEPISLEKPAGKTRILFLGGSTVYCMRTTWERTHPRLLEKALREARPDLDLELQNCGLDWYTTQHSLINWLFRLREFKPDIVILFHGINDLCRSFSPASLAYGPPRRDYGHFFGPVARLALGHTRQGQIPHPYTVAWAFDHLLYSDLIHPPVKRGPVQDFASLSSFERNLRLIVRNLQDDDVRLVLATQPSLYRADLGEEAIGHLWMLHEFCETDGRVPDLPSITAGMAKFNAVTRAVAKETGTPLVELARNVPRDLEHFVDDCHYTEKGNARVAELMTAGVLAAKVLPKRRAEAGSGPVEGQ